MPSKATIMLKIPHGYNLVKNVPSKFYHALAGDSTKPRETSSLSKITQWTTPKRNLLINKPP